jgi:hypothetical protein
MESFEGSMPESAGVLYGLCHDVNLGCDSDLVAACERNQLLRTNW